MFFRQLALQLEGVSFLELGQRLMAKAEATKDKKKPAPPLVQADQEESQGLCVLFLT